MAVAGVAQNGIAPAVDHDVMLIRHQHGQVEVFFHIEQHARARHGLRKGDGPGRLHFALQPAQRVDLFPQREADRRSRQRLGRELGFALQTDRPETDAAATHLARLRADRGERQTGHHFLEKSFEVLAAHAILELQALNAGLREAFAPIPCLQLAQREPSEDHFVTEEREQRARLAGLEILDLLIGDIEGALPRRMSQAIQRHRGERLGERVEKTSGIAAHRLITALRTSGSFDAAASARTAAARASLRQLAASAISAASNSSDRTASFARPSQLVPPSTSCSSAFKASALRTRPRTLMARTRSSEAVAAVRANSATT